VASADALFNNKAISVKWFALCYLSCPVLSVCDVGVLWPNSRMDQIKMKLGMQVGLGPGHTVLAS